MIKFYLDKGGKYAVIETDHLTEIREHFSVENDNAKFIKRFNRFASPRQYAITPTGRFDAPLFSEILKYLLASNNTDEIVIEDSEFKHCVSPANHLWGADHSTEPYKLNLELRDYQADIVNKCLVVGRGTVVLATAGGKTLTMASLISRVFTFFKSTNHADDFKCLVIVPDRGLASQTYNDFTSYGVPFTFSKWTGDDALNLSSNVIIANAGIMQSENSNLDWAEFVDMLVVDEVHKVRKGNQITDLIKNIKTYCKFGFTGTMPEGLLDQWNIIGKVGPIIYEKNSTSLRKEGYISNVICQVIEISYKDIPAPVEDKMKAYRAELEFIISNQYRNNVLGTLAKNVTNNSLILVDFIEHGLILEEILKKMCTDKQVFFIRGSVEIDERERIKQLIESNTNVVVVAISKIFSTGIDIKNLHYIIFAGGGKAKIKVLQSIGRGLRLHTSKQKLTLIDIVDDLKYGNRHADKRQNLYEKENIPFSIKKIEEA